MHVIFEMNVNVMKVPIVARALETRKLSGKISTLLEWLEMG